MDYYKKATEILDKKIKEDKIQHLLGKHSPIYETSIKAIIEALSLNNSKFHVLKTENHTCNLSEKQINHQKRLADVDYHLKKERM